MKAGTQAAVAVGIGYLLGRRRKLRRTAILAAIAASGRSGGLSKALVGRGLKALEATELAGKLTPQLGEIADTARSELLDAGKAAAVTMVTNRVESLSDALHSRAQVLTDPAAAGTGVAERAGGGRSQGDEPDDDGDDDRSGRGGREEDRYDEDRDQYGEYEADEEDYEDYEDHDDSDYAPEDEYQADDQEEPDGDGAAIPAPRRERSRVTSSPVSRTGR